MYSLYKGGGGGPGVLLGKRLENLECRKAIYHIFKSYSLYIYFYFSLISFLYFFIFHFFKFSGFLYILSLFFAHYSLISIKNGNYSLTSKPHPGRYTG